MCGRQSRERLGSDSKFFLGANVFGGTGGVDHVGEGALEAEGDQVDDVDVERDEEASGALVPE